MQDNWTDDHSGIIVNQSISLMQVCCMLRISQKFIKDTIGFFDIYLLKYRVIMFPQCNVFYACSVSLTSSKMLFSC